MANSSQYLEFSTREGNKSYVKVDSIIAMYHDGQATRIIIKDGLSGAPIHLSLSSSEMPSVLFARLSSSK